MLVRPIRPLLVCHRSLWLRDQSSHGYSALRLLALHPQQTFRQYFGVRSSTDLAAHQTSAASAYSGELRGVFPRKIHTSRKSKERIDEQRSASQHGAARIWNANATPDLKPKDSGYGWTVVTQQGSLESFKRQALELMPLSILSPYDDPLLVVLFSPHGAGDVERLNDIVFQVLARVYRPANGSTLQLHVLSAIVDKVSIPSHTEGVTQVDDLLDGADGFSFWWTRRGNLQYHPQEPSQDRTQIRGSLTVHINGKARQSNDEIAPFSRFGIPLANTTFITGSDYTMSLTRMIWENVQGKENGAWSFGSRSFNNVQQLHKQNVALNISDNHQQLLPQTRPLMTASELTPWRPVQDVSGNVVKALRGPDGRLPASEELETAITQLAPASYGGFEVWAEIRPANQHAQGKEDFPRYAKVVGGGGGWGDKRGLIALDAEPAVELPSKAEQGFPEELDLGKMLSNVVEPGDQIRFVSFPIGKPSTNESAKGENLASLPSHVYIQEENQISFGFGTTGNPELVEDDPLRPGSPGSSQVTSSMHTIFGHFGAMSQRIYYEHTNSSKDQLDKQHATNLPPYTYFASGGKFVPISEA